MRLPDGYLDISTGKIAAIVTSLEMRGRPQIRVERVDAPWRLERFEQPALDWYRDLYRRVGQDWLWFARLRLADADLAAILHDPAIEIHALIAETGRAEGLLELDYRVAGECELAFFGVTAPLIGTGAGRWLMNRALECAWARPIERFWVHTCSFDHPDALAFYRRSGFVPFRRQIEIADDPRLSGLAPVTAAAHIPIIEGGA